MLTLNAKNLTLEQVHRLLSFCKLPSRAFSTLLNLESINQPEQEELAQTREDFDR
ncbi:hypothetical protein TUMEXPCC7403_23280 [Tumidithrix helvetica PCC 7403]|uniref:hypothetical protein n=1 Tax=Tumidithrix helvetica TaxID=3457545 RepID=UPI003CA6B00A